MSKILILIHGDKFLINKIKFKSLLAKFLFIYYIWKLFFGISYCYCYFILLRIFFTAVLADGFSLEFEREQISSSLQVSSQYSSRSWQCCSLDGLHWSYDF